MPPPAPEIGAHGRAFRREAACGAARTTPEGLWASLLDPDMLRHRPGKAVPNLTAADPTAAGAALYAAPRQPEKNHANADQTERQVRHGAAGGGGDGGVRAGGHGVRDGRGGFLPAGLEERKRGMPFLPSLSACRE